VGEGSAGYGEWSHAPNLDFQTSGLRISWWDTGPFLSRNKGKAWQEPSELRSSLL
jgi:hypothetical protein